MHGPHKCILCIMRNHMDRQSVMNHHSQDLQLQRFKRVEGLLAFWDSWVVRYRILWSKNLEILVRIFTYRFNNLFNNNNCLYPKLQLKKSTTCKYCNFIFSLINRCIFVLSNMLQHLAPDSNASVWHAVWVCGSGGVGGWRLWKT